VRGGWGRKFGEKRRCGLFRDMRDRADSFRIQSLPTAQVAAFLAWARAKNEL